MTDLRTAAQQALEALELTQTDVHWELNSPTRKFLRKAKKALRAALAEEALQRFTDVNQEIEAALAEPVQEPVAWRWGYRSVTTGEMDWRGYVEIAAHPNLRSPEIIMEPLYTSPPQRKPLTEEEMEFMWEADTTSAEDCQSLYYFKVVARAIERAHGIE